MKEKKTIQIPTEFSRLLDSDWREAAVYGGRFSLKSHTVARILLIRARQKKTRVACFREFQNSITESSHQLLKDLIELYELTDFVVTDKAIVNTVNGSDFLFKGLRLNEQSVKSIEGIDIAWVEEAQTVTDKSIEVLTPTVRKEGSQIIYTYNRLLEEDPVHKRLVIDGRPNTLVLNINYETAIKYGWMPDVILNEMESDKKNRPKLYKAKWLGEPSAKEGKIYSNWKQIDELPHEARLVSIGVDFGFTNDPTVAVGIYKHNEGYIMDEIVSQKGMLTKTIADSIKSYLLNMGEQALTIADGAEPRTIEEIRQYGVNIMRSDKRSGSVTYGIEFVKAQKISVTQRSYNVLKSYNNYLWKENREGKNVNVPHHDYSDAMDAIRYGFDIIRPSDMEQTRYTRPKPQMNSAV